MTSHALVAYASKHGSTAEIAELIGATLRDRGIVADVIPAREVRRLDDYGVVILGSAVYMFHWQGDATAFLKRFERDLPTRPTWLFSTGPIGGNPNADAKVAAILTAQPPPPGEIVKRAERIGARGHMTFGGRAGPEMTGFMERHMPRGDWRDLDAVRAWAHTIADAVPRMAMAPA